MTALAWEAPHPLYEMPVLTRMAPLERAAFELANTAHEGQTRNKPINPRPPYITHPVMAYQIGKQIGIKDVITLGAVLTHDCLEQGVINGKRLDLKSNIQKFNEDSIRKNIIEYFQNFKWPNVIKSFTWYGSIVNHLQMVPLMF
ncbi:MAG: hypothetical protein U1E36_08680 [Rickettsiales bacterium]